jgi:hypothetical protein
VTWDLICGDLPIWHNVAVLGDPRHWLILLVFVDRSLLIGSDLLIWDTMFVRREMGNLVWETSQSRTPLWSVLCAPTCNLQYKRNLLKVELTQTRACVLQMTSGFDRTSGSHSTSGFARAKPSPFPVFHESKIQGNSTKDFFWFYWKEKRAGEKRRESKSFFPILNP